MSEIPVEGAAALLTTTVQRRIHLERIMNIHMVITVVSLLVLWSFSLTSGALLGSLGRYGRYSGGAEVFIVIVTALSALIVGVWRLLARRLDDQVARLYPDIVLYEGVLSAPPDAGTAGYLSRSVPHLRMILNDSSLSPEVKGAALRKLAEGRRLGHRGTQAMNIAALVFLVAMTLLALSLLGGPNGVFWFLMLGHGGGFSALYLASNRYQRNPDEEAVWKAIEASRPPKEEKDGD